MDKKIALEEGLSDIKEILQENGYQVLDMNGVNEASAVIITGMDENAMNMQDITTEVPVINAEGKSAEEILMDLKQRNI